MSIIQKEDIASLIRNYVHYDNLASQFYKQTQNARAVRDDYEKRIIEELNKIIDSVIEKRNTENQQLYFMEYNDVNVSDKQKYLDKATVQFNKVENDFLLNQSNFINMLNQNKKEEKENNLFYNILKYIVISIIVLAIINLIISEIL